MWEITCPLVQEGHNVPYMVNSSQFQSTEGESRQRKVSSMLLNEILVKQSL